MSFEVFWLISFVLIIAAFTLFARSVEVNTTADASSRRGILHFGGFVVFAWLFVGLVGFVSAQKESQPPVSETVVKK